MLSPLVDSHNLILSSDVNLTITGTTAWESILYERPVIAFGPLCYGYFDLIYKCANISDLPDLITRALTEFRPDRELLLKFIWSFLSSADTFRWGDSLGDPAVAERKNLEKIANGIVGAAKATLKSRQDTVSGEYERDFERHSDRVV